MNMPGDPLGFSRPIGSGNRSEPDQRVNPDRAHGGMPDHVDMVIRIPSLKIAGLGAHKIRVDGQGNIISDELT